MSRIGRPRYSLHNGPSDNLRYQHHIEWPNDGWEYTSTRAVEADHPDGWKPVPPAKGWRLNVDRWPCADEEAKYWERVGPGVLRDPYGRGGPVLIAYWRRQR